MDRFKKAKEAGFDYVEFWDWAGKDVDAIERAAEEAQIKIASFQGSIRGVMVDKNDRDIYIEDLKKSIVLASRLKAKAVFCMSDIMQEDRSVKPHQYLISPSEMRENTISVLHELAPIAEEAEVTLVIEPLNTIVDHAGYSLSSTAEGVEIIRAVGSPSVKLLYDAYHMQIMEGNIIETIKANAKYFGHFHIADVPGRHQPGTGELNYANIIKALKDTGYSGIVGFEFSPSGKPDEEVIAEVLTMLK
ncbi:MAG: TIM barrel protein [Eubacteriales bacterium]|nr:TIM barrel protein [Eubacteriales bacterium]